ncbi:aspartate aminotransferase family protein [Labrys okinawensis]|uniref:aspartate aminotransferase family protein n=1 Tax=Labrys okinawensis TaxID=346911 RepID=UPI0039BC86D5
MDIAKRGKGNPMRASATAKEGSNALGRGGNISPTEQALFDDAARFFPGGALGGNALAADARFVFDRGDGSRFWDASGNEYIDYVLCSGAMFLGHAHPAIQKAVADQVSRGTHAFAYLNETAIRLARRVMPHIRCAERIRFTTAGSDSTFHAIRLARAFTGREKILKFEGAYHGVHDYAQLSTAPKVSGNFPHGVPDTAGIPAGVQDLMLVAPFNDPETLASILAEHHQDIAAIIIEPIQRILHPKPGFLQAVRELTAKYGIVMILDEVVTGFRYGIGGAQGYFDVVPDLATYGKIIGGGLPVGAVAGRKDIMDQADPTNKGKPGYVYQNGTLQGHMLGCAASLATMDVLEQPGVYDNVFAMADKLREGLQKVFDRHNLGILVFGEGPMWHMLFTDKVPQDWREVIATDTKRMATFEAELLRQGLFILPNNRRFISIRHTQDDLEQTFEAADRAARIFKR